MIREKDTALVTSAGERTGTAVAKLFRALKNNPPRSPARWYEENEINAPSWVSGECTAYCEEECCGN